MSTEYSSFPPAAPEPAPVPAPRRNRWPIITVGASVAALAAGLLIGGSGDPTTSSEYTDLAATLDQATSDLADANMRAAEAESEVEALTIQTADLEAARDQAREDLANATAGADQREADLDARESDLDAREAAVTTREADAEARAADLDAREAEVKGMEDLAEASQFGGGVHLVGTDIQPGTYRSSRGDWCYWARLSGLGGELRDIIANDNVFEGQAIVTIGANDHAFESSGCGTWTLVQ